MTPRSWKLILDHILIKTGALVKEGEIYYIGSESILRQIAESESITRIENNFSQRSIDVFEALIKERGYEFN